MKKLTFLLGVLGIAACTPAEGTTNPDLARWEQQARNVTITRDDWGIAHVHGKTDADAVFGLVYAQAEDDFNRVETNYINSMGRLAEAEGEKEIWRDLRMKLFIDPDSMKAKYESSPPWLKSLMVALGRRAELLPRQAPGREAARHHALRAVDGAHVQRGQHRRRHRAREPPRARGVLRRQARGAEDDLGSRRAAFRRSRRARTASRSRRRTRRTSTRCCSSTRTRRSSSAPRCRCRATKGSTRTAPSRGASSSSIRASTTASAGCTRRAASTTSTSTPRSVVKKGDGLFYQYGKDLRPLVSQKITVPYKTANGMAKKEFTIYRTQHGPIVRSADGKWISVRLMQEPVKALTQSYSRTKAKSYAEFRKVMDLHTNSSNNTIFASADGDIAYFHANFIPKRDPKFDWTKPVDGSNPATEWGELLCGRARARSCTTRRAVGSTTRTTGRTAPPGRTARRRRTSPRTWRRAARTRAACTRSACSKDRKDFTLGSLLSAAFDSYLTAFDVLLPPLLQAYDKTPAGSPAKAKVAEQIDSLRKWDQRWSANSVPTSLAVFWGDEISRRVGQDAREEGLNVDQYIATRTTPAATARRARRGVGFADRGLRLVEDAVGEHQPLPAPERRHRAHVRRRRRRASRSASRRRAGGRSRRSARAPYPNTKKWYGTSGNSFVAVVEFGDSVRARAVTAGGESGDPKSKHFNDQARALRDRQPARCVLLSESAEGAHRTTVFAGELAEQVCVTAGDGVGKRTIEPQRTQRSQR